MSPLPRRVEAAGVRGLRRKRDPSAIRPCDFFDESDRLRGLFGRLVRGDAERVALVPSVSYALSAVARNEELGPGRSVVVAEGQFPSAVYPWRERCVETGAELRIVPAPPPGEGRGATWNARLLQAVDARTSVVALPPCHWSDGTRFDLEAIGHRAREVGAALIVDGTQAVGAVPFDVARVRPDVLAVAGYKWLLGPYSLGAAWYGPRYDRRRPLEETWTSRPGSEDFAGLTRYRDGYRAGARRYDVGEHSNFILVPMLAAALELLLEWGVEAVAERCASLGSEIAAAARELGLWVEDEAWRAAHLLGLHLPTAADPEQLRTALAARRVQVSVRGRAVRVSPHVYNDTEDVEALREGLRAALGRRS